jgi:(p)ppGpp synthase/HD superfamily hydrolase
MELTDRFKQALLMMYKLHSTQIRKGTKIPYISHLLAVTTIVLENGSHEDEVIAALLHDAAEDAGGKEILIQIRERFGDRVADIVEHCSDTLEADKPPWQPRKEAYLASLATINDPSILLVSIADKLHNAKSILKDYKTCGNELWTRFSATERQIIWYYQSLLSIYQSKSHLCPGHLVEELQQTIKELASYIK